MLDKSQKVLWPSLLQNKVSVQALGALRFHFVELFLLIQSLVSYFVEIDRNPFYYHRFVGVRCLELWITEN
jgi:hypothetical protein